MGGNWDAAWTVILYAVELVVVVMFVLLRPEKRMAILILGYIAAGPICGKDVITRNVKNIHGTESAVS